MIDNAVSYYRHLRDQGVEPSKAVAHVEHRYGIPGTVVKARVNGGVADPERTRTVLAQIRSRQDWERERDARGLLEDLYEAITGESLDAKRAWTYDKTDTQYDAPCSLCGEGPLTLRGYGGECPNGHITEGV